jgi:hypothetical protein
VLNLEISSSTVETPTIQTPTVVPDISQRKVTDSSVPVFPEVKKVPVMALQSCPVETKKLGLMSRRFYRQFQQRVTASHAVNGSETVRRDTCHHFRG